MNNDDNAVPLSNEVDTSKPKTIRPTKKREDKSNNKAKKRKVNLWPLKALAISLILSMAVNALSNIALSDAHIVLAYTITFIIVAIGVMFDMVGTAVTTCDIQPLLSMASKKVKGAKTAVKLAQSRDAVSSVCCDIIGDICGVVSGVCAATIVTTQLGAQPNFWLSILVYALIATITITSKAVGKGLAVSKSSKIVMSTARLLSIFNKEG